MFWVIIGWLAVFFTISQFIPQIIKAIRTKKLKDVSLGTFLLITLTATTWILYGIHISDIILIFANSLVLVSVLTIIFLKYRYK